MIYKHNQTRFTKGARLAVHTTPQRIIQSWVDAIRRASGLGHAILDSLSFEVNGEIRTMDMTEAVQTIERMGLWGFSDVQKGRVHIWCGSARTDIQKLPSLIGHELGHIAEERMAKELKEDEYDDEVVANAYGEVAAKTIRWIARIMEKLG